MADQAIKLVSAINTVNATQASLETFFAQIDQLDANVSGQWRRTAGAVRTAALSSHGSGPCCGVRSSVLLLTVALFAD